MEFNDISYIISDILYRTWTFGFISSEKTSQKMFAQAFDVLSRGFLPSGKGSTLKGTTLFFSYTCPKAVQ